MRRKIGSGDLVSELMGAYATWLEREGKSRSTIGAYQSRVRSAIRHLGTPFPSDVELHNYLAELDVMADKKMPVGVPSTSPAGARTAWRSYVKFMWEVKGRQIPDVRRHQPKSIADAPLTEEAEATLRELGRLVGPRGIYNAKWSDFKELDPPGGQFYLHKALERLPIYWTLPEKVVLGCLAWSKPGSDLSKPLFARAPGADESYSLAGMKKLLTKAKRPISEIVAERRADFEAKRKMRGIHVPTPDELWALERNHPMNVRTTEELVAMLDRHTGRIPAEPAEAEEGEPEEPEGIPFPGPLEPGDVPMPGPLPGPLVEEPEPNAEEQVTLSKAELDALVTKAAKAAAAAVEAALAARGEK